MRAVLGAGLMIVFDVGDRKTFEEATGHWFEQSMNYCADGVFRLLCGNKYDKTKAREVDESEGVMFALSKNIFYSEVDIDDLSSVQTAFDSLFYPAFRSLTATRPIG